MSRRESHISLDTQKLLAFLNQRGMSAADLAREAEVSATTISGLLQHGRPISVRSARRIAKALEDHPPILAELLAAEVA